MPRQQAQRVSWIKEKRYQPPVVLSDVE
jgi:hypothetical protein